MKTKSIKQLVELALSKAENVKAEYTIGKLPPKQSKIIEEKIGLKLVGVERIMDVYMVRHALLHHGSIAGEEKRGQVAVTIDDFNKVPDILKSPDTIKYLGKNNLRQDIFLYSKKIGLIYFVVEAVRVSKRGNLLVFQTMYKRKKPRD